MDFIERMFGVSPDGGDGSIELMFFAAVIAVALLLAWQWRRRGRGGGSSAG